jgi:hypothetical protein
MKNDAEKTEVKKGSSLVIIFKNSDGKETRMSVQAGCDSFAHLVYEIAHCFKFTIEEVYELAGIDLAEVPR